MICKLSAMLAGMLEREKIIRAEDRAVYEYGFQITIANITNALIVLLIGLITHSIVRVLIFYTVFLVCGCFAVDSMQKHIPGVSVCLVQPACYVWLRAMELWNLLMYCQQQ